MLARAVAASQHPGDNRGVMVLAVFPHPIVLPLGIPGPLLNPKPRAEKPFCTRSAPLGVGVVQFVIGAKRLYVADFPFCLSPFPFEGEGFM